jgi:hypothetical protein
MAKERKEMIPDSVRAEASKIECELGTLEPDERARAARILDRLLSDPRMEEVWRYLYRKRRAKYAPTEEFENPAWPQLPDEREVRAKQDKAAAYLFRSAFQLAFHPVEYATEADAMELVNELFSVADELRKQEDRLCELGRFELATELEEIRKKCEEDANWSTPLRDEHFPIERHTEDDQLRAYVMELAQVTQWLFGKAMRGTLARIAQAALDRKDVTPEAVREMLR